MACILTVRGPGYPLQVCDDHSLRCHVHCGGGEALPGVRGQPEGKGTLYVAYACMGAGLYLGYEGNLREKVHRTLRMHVCVHESDHLIEG